MSVTNPERVVTKQDLADFYEGIFPYLGGNAEAGFTPIGTIIAVMGNSAPTNYLACNGQIVNIADYPELANYFKAQFGSYNYFGGDGTTTFAICDLRGEFLRGTGTNSHENQGNGADVGVHQDATKIPYFQLENYTTPKMSFLSLDSNHQTSYIANADKLLKGDTTRIDITGSSDSTLEPYNNQVYMTRPTNTSVLFCIATKNIYLNPSLSYTEEEKVVGQWINGKTLYQKTIIVNSPSLKTNIQCLTNVDYGFITSYDLQLSDGRHYSGYWNTASDYVMLANSVTTDNILNLYVCSTAAISKVTATVQYTKAT